MPTSGFHSRSQRFLKLRILYLSLLAPIYHSTCMIIVQNAMVDPLMEVPKASTHLTPSFLLSIVPGRKISALCSIPNQVLSMRICTSPGPYQSCISQALVTIGMVMATFTLRDAFRAFSIMIDDISLSCEARFIQVLAFAVWHHFHSLSLRWRKTWQDEENCPSSKYGKLRTGREAL